MRWYNYAPCHSGIRYVTEAQRRAGEDHQILAARHAVYCTFGPGSKTRLAGQVLLATGIQ